MVGSQSPKLGRLTRTRIRGTQPFGDRDGNPKGLVLALF